MGNSYTSKGNPKSYRFIRESFEYDVSTQVLHNLGTFVAYYIVLNEIARAIFGDVMA